MAQTPKLHAALFGKAPASLPSTGMCCIHKTYAAKVACQVVLLSGRLCTQTPWPAQGKGQHYSEPKPHVTKRPLWTHGGNFRP